MRPESPHLRTARCVAAYLRAVLTEAGHAVTTGPVTVSQVHLHVDGHPVEWVNRPYGFYLSTDWHRDIIAQHSPDDWARVKKWCNPVLTDKIERHRNPDPIDVLEVPPRRG